MACQGCGRSTKRFKKNLKAKQKKANLDKNAILKNEERLRKGREERIKARQERIRAREKRSAARQARIRMRNLKAEKAKKNSQ